MKVNATSFLWLIFAVTEAALGLYLTWGSRSFEKLPPLCKNNRGSHDGIKLHVVWLAITCDVLLLHNLCLTQHGQHPEFWSLCEQLCLLELVMWGSQETVERPSSLGHLSLSFQPNMKYPADKILFYIHGLCHQHNRTLSHPDNGINNSNKKVCDEVVVLSIIWSPMIHILHYLYRIIVISNIKTFWSMTNCIYDSGLIKHWKIPII